jgi:calcineurin-like phosphoesterase family protein
MTDVLCERWNSVVQPNDFVYHLGDFIFRGKPERIRPRLNGNIYLIKGSHDRDIKNDDKNFSCVRTGYVTIKLSGIYITLSHLALRVWEKSHYNQWHLYGHSHNKLPPLGKSFDVGADVWGYTPISFDQVVAQMDKLPDNPGFGSHTEEEPGE